MYTSYFFSIKNSNGDRYKLSIVFLLKTHYGCYMVTLYVSITYPCYNLQPLPNAHIM